MDRFFNSRTPSEMFLRMGNMPRKGAEPAERFEFREAHVKRKPLAIETLTDFGVDQEAKIRDIINENIMAMFDTPSPGGLLSNITNATAKKDEPLTKEMLSDMMHSLERWSKEPPPALIDPVSMGLTVIQTQWIDAQQHWKWIAYRSPKLHTLESLGVYATTPYCFQVRASFDAKEMAPFEMRLNDTASLMRMPYRPGLPQGKVFERVEIGEAFTDYAKRVGAEQAARHFLPYLKAHMKEVFGVDC